MANAFKSKVSQAVGTSVTTIYTVPAATTTTVIGLTVANLLTSNITVDISLWKAGASATYIVKSAPISAGGSLVVVGGSQKLVMETTDVIKIVSNTASSADVILSILEIS